MAFRLEAAIGLTLGLGLAAGADLRVEARHNHLRKACSGVLVFGERGVAFEGKGKKAHRFGWDYSGIQQLLVEPARIRLLTYEDVKWKLGADRELEFQAVAGDFRAAYQTLKSRMDQRLVGALAEGAEPLWEAPAKLLGLVAGAQGRLVLAADRVVFDSPRPGRSRTWLDRDIENISSTGPFEFTLTSHERSRRHYGSRKSFQFQLRQPLPEQTYNRLWRRLTEARHHSGEQP